MSDFLDLLNKKVDKLFLIVWAPWGEEKVSDIDMSFGYVFTNEPDKLFVISVKNNELWAPHISIENIPENRYAWKDFYPRIKMWMNADDENLIIGKEYFDVSESDLFENIIGHDIEGIELLNLAGIPESFGVKLLFKSDYIISLPNSDGNTVETKNFNRNDTIEHFRRLGNIVYSKI